MSQAELDYQLLYQEASRALVELEAKFAAELAQKEAEIGGLNDKLSALLKQLFGFKSEKLKLSTAPADQLSLFSLAPTEEAVALLSEQAAEALPAQEPAKASPNPSKAKKRMTLPAELPRVEVIIEPQGDLTDCVLIGEVVTEVLEVIPAQFFVKRYIRRKYARAGGQGILIGELPSRAIEKGIPSESLLAQIAVDKYVFHLPLHRQIERYKRIGVHFSASTFSDWVAVIGKWLYPLGEALKRETLAHNYLQADETPIKVLDKQKKGDTHQGYYWIYHAPLSRLVWFDYQQGRSQTGPKTLLDNFRGILQTDGYVVYDALFNDSKQVQLMHCMAHARRKFFDALNYDKARAEHVLGQIQQLYLIEQDLREQDLTIEAKAKERQRQATPILTAMDRWLHEHVGQVLPSSPIGKAIEYALKRWDRLSLYTQHGQLEIDNNLAENAIRPVAVGRKNYLFAGSHQAAQTAAMIYSLMATCKKHGIDEFTYLQDILTRLPEHKANTIHELLPHRWQKQA